MKVNIGKASEELGVTRETLRLRERPRKITVEHTPKGHRRYDMTKLRGLERKKDIQRRTLAYARVSSHVKK